MRRRHLSVTSVFIFAVYFEIIYRLFPEVAKEHHNDDPQFAPPPPQQVYIFPQDYRQDLAGELQHFIRNGIASSPRLVESHDMEAGIWVVDLVRHKCDLLVKDLQANQTLQPRQVYLIDFDDQHEKGFGDLEICISNLNKLFGSKKRVRYAVKVHVRGRHLVHSSAWRNHENETFANYGEVIHWENEPLGELVNGGVQVLRYGVRSDIVKHVKTRLKNNSNVVEIDRPDDVAHFWKVGEETNQYGHRSIISETVLDLGKEYPNLSVFANVTGQRKRIGRNSVQHEYVDALLRHKIIVVSQPDMWEDHYKLMEALACGAMVMTDPMHPLPYKIYDGESVVVYHSTGDLKRKILYYLQHDKERLQIATRGHEVAMKYHQSREWMERLLFGERPLP